MTLALSKVRLPQTCLNQEVISLAERTHHTWDLNALPPGSDFLGWRNLTTFSSCHHQSDVTWCLSENLRLWVSQMDRPDQQGKPRSIFAVPIMTCHLDAAIRPARIYNHPYYSPSMDHIFWSRVTLTCTPRDRVYHYLAKRTMDERLLSKSLFFIWYVASHFIFC